MSEYPLDGTDRADRAQAIALATAYWTYHKDGDFVPLTTALDAVLQSDRTPGVLLALANYLASAAEQLAQTDEAEGIEVLQSYADNLLNDPD